MFGIFKKKKKEDEEQSQQQVMAKLKGEPYSRNSYRIEVQLLGGETSYIVQYKFYNGSGKWFERGTHDSEQEAREEIRKAKERDYEAFLKEEKAKQAILVKYIDV